MFRGTLRGYNLRLEEESLNLRLEEELRSFVEPGPGTILIHNMHVILASDATLCWTPGNI